MTNFYPTQLFALLPNYCQKSYMWGLTAVKLHTHYITAFSKHLKHWLVIPQLSINHSLISFLLIIKLSTLYILINFSKFCVFLSFQVCTIQCNLVNLTSMFHQWKFHLPRGELYCESIHRCVWMAWKLKELLLTKINCILKSL